MNYEDINEPVTYPKWWGENKFHDSHKANLLKKDTEFYSRYKWNVDPSSPYVWMDEKENWYEQHSGQKGRVYLYEEVTI
jgi:hypothetical protein